MKMRRDQPTPPFLQSNRMLVLITVGLVAAVIVTSLPTVFYIWDPPSKEHVHPETGNQSDSSHCHNSQGVKWDSLVASPCSAYLNWSQTKDYPDSRNISILKCDFESTEKDLEKIQAFLNSISNSKECQRHASPLLCHHIYQDCEMSPPRPSTQECLVARHEVCKGLWDLAAQYLSTASFGKCTAIPDCYRDFSNISTSRHHTVPTLSEITPQNETRTQKKSGVECKPPLVQTELQDITPHLECSPRCLEEGWTTKSEQRALEAMLYLTAIISLFCIVITFITWAKVGELRKFPQSSLLFLVIAYSIALVGFALPLIVGRSNAYCKYSDVLSTWSDPSVICRIQGSLVHFGFTSALFWWLSSIFNVFISVFVVSPINPIRRYSNLVFIIEASLSVIVPIILVSIVFGVDGKYTMFTSLVITCGPPTLKLFYFTMAFPVQLIVLVGIGMTSFIVLRLQRAQTSASTCSSPTTTTSTTQATIQIRFLMIIIVFPLSIGVIMSTISIYDKLSQDTIAEFIEYISCLQNKTSADVCAHLYHSYTGIITAIIDLIMFDILSLVVFAYVLAPTLAQKFWMKQIRNVRQRVSELVANVKSRSVDGKEVWPTELPPEHSHTTAHINETVFPSSAEPTITSTSTE